MSGLDKGKVMSLFISLTPLVMGTLGRAKNQAGGGQGGGLMDIIMTANNVLNGGTQGGGLAGIFGSILGQKAHQQSTSNQNQSASNKGNDLLGSAVKGLFNKFLKGK